MCALCSPIYTLYAYVIEYKVKVKIIIDLLLLKQSKASFIQIIGLITTQLVFWNFVITMIFMFKYHISENMSIAETTCNSVDF